MDVTDGELVEYISESSMMSKALVDYEGMHALHSLLTAVQMCTRLCLTFASLYLRLASSKCTSHTAFHACLIGQSDQC